MQQQLTELTTSNSSRRAALEQLSHQTAAARSEVLGNTLPTVLRYQSLTLSHVSAMLAREQRVRLRELMDIFPLRINAVRSSGGPIQITICNLRLPENAAAPAGGWSEPQVCASWGPVGCCTLQPCIGQHCLISCLKGLPACMSSDRLHELDNQRFAVVGSGSFTSVWMFTDLGL